MIISIYNYWRFKDRRKTIIDAFKKLLGRSYRWTEQDIIFYENLIETLNKR